MNQLLTANLILDTILHNFTMLHRVPEDQKVNEMFLSIHKSQLFKWPCQSAHNFETFYNYGAVNTQNVCMPKLLYCLIMQIYLSNGAQLLKIYYVIYQR